MASKREIFVDWLRDAYAMEQEALTLMQGQVDRLEHYPAMQAKLREHIEETRQQADAIKECLNRYGSDTSTIKEIATKAVATAQAMFARSTKDEVLKTAIINTNFEAFEIASYRCNIAGAEELGDMETKRVLEGILVEEERMYAWLNEHIPEMTRTYMRAAAAEKAEAKR